MAKILVVDDEKIIVKGIRFSLLQDQMEVDCAYDGEEALNMVQEKEYDIVLLDVMLPKVDGFAVLELIRKESLVPVLMVTARDSVEDQVRGFHLQADDYIPKPL